MKLFRNLSLLTILALTAPAFSAEGDIVDVRDTPDAPVNLIFDTDIGGDIDDAFALQIIHHFADREQCNLLGVTLTTATASGPAYVAAQNAVNGRPDIPVGYLEKGTTYDSYLSQPIALKKENGEALYPVPEGFKPEPNVVLLRKLLAAAEDNSVVIAQVGYSTNLAALLDSPADDISPMTGKELAAKKVRLVSIMGGAFVTAPELEQYRTHREWNIINDIPAAQKLCKEWPSPILFSGVEVGDRIRMSTVSLTNDYRTHRAKFLYDSFDFWAKMNAPNEGFKHERPTWDLTSVLFVVRPEVERGYYSVERGNVTFDDNGVTIYTPDPNGKHFVAKVNAEQCIRVREAFVNLCSEK